MKRLTRIKALLTACVAVALLLVTLVACGNEKRLVSITLVEPPTNTYYELGEAFRLEEDNVPLTVEALYSDDSVWTVPLSADMVTFSADTVGAATVTISYTENGVTARTYLTVTVGNTLRDFRAAAVDALKETDLYKAHKNDRGVATLFDAAQIAIYSAVDAESVRTEKERFLRDLEILVSDKKAARDAVAAVSLEGLVGSWLLLAENNRDHTLVEIEIAANSETALAYAALYAEQVERYKESQAASATAELKAGFILRLRDYFTQTVDANRGMYSNDGYLTLQDLFEDAEIRILLSETRVEAEGIFNEAMTEAAAQATVIDEAYTALVAIYGDRGAVLYSDEVEAAITAAEAAVATVRESTLGDAFVDHMNRYGVAFELRVEGITYDDGKCNIPAAVEAARARYTALAAAAGSDATAALSESVAAIGSVDLTVKDKLDAARAAYLAWYETNGIDELNAGSVLLGTLYETLTAAEAAYAARVTAATEGAASVYEAIAAIGTVTLGSSPAIEAARTAYDTFCTSHGNGAENYVGNRETLTAAESDFATLRTAAVEAATELKGFTYDALDTLDKIVDAETKYAAWKTTYGEEHEEEYLTAAVKTAIETSRSKYTEFKTAHDLALSELAAAYANNSPSSATTPILTEGNAAIEAVAYAAWRTDTTVFATLVADYSARIIAAAGSSGT